MTEVEEGPCAGFRSDNFSTSDGAKYFWPPKTSISDILTEINVNDAVNHPAHYTQGGVECIDAIRAAMTFEEFCGYLRGNVIKYMWRYNDKGGIQDLAKAKWYLNRLIDERKKQNNG